MANNAKMIDVNTIIQAGMDPKTGLPIKLIGETKEALKPNIKKLLRILDEQNAINRYKWYNLPSGLDGQMIERILYYRGQAMFFYIPELEQFFFLPYCLDGSIDIYGRYTEVRPLPFNGTTETKKDDKMNPIAKYITSLTREPIYDIWTEELTTNIMDRKCVLLSDYSKQISQTNIPRQILQDPLLDVMADCVPFLRTALLNGTGVAGMRVNSQDEYSNVQLASTAIDNAALNGEKYVPIIGNVDFQDLTTGQVGKAEEYLLAMQSLDNLRLSFYGLDNGGLFQKKSHVLEAEQEMNSGNVGLVYQDGLTLRENFCDMVNSLTGLGIWCEASETVLGLDTNLDGVISDEQDQSGEMPGQQPSQEGV
jgi:hypothetical protein